MILSIYMDITKGSIHTVPEKQVEEIYKNYAVQQIQVKQGDTFISIIEDINPSLKEWNINELITDFQVINPTKDPYQLQINHYYYFPVYD